jgi:hypothetical protein
MTGEKKMFTSYVKSKDSQNSIIFGDGNQGKVKGLGKIAISNEHSISNVFLVESLGYNLLSVSQLCHMGYNCLFTNVDVSVFRRSDGSLAFKGVLDDKLYLVDFSKEEADPTLFTKTCDGDLFVCQIYVDDIIFGSTNQKSCEEFSRVITQKFEMSMMGELNYFLEFQVKQLKDGTFISQMKYTQDLLKRFGMKDAKPAKTPIGTDGHVDLNKGGKSVDQKAYRSMIGSLLYLCASRPDIILSVCMCARFQSDPRECHLVAVKRILRYLVATPCFGIWYPKGSTFDLIGYSDSDYAGCKVDRKSTSGMCQFLGRSLVSWSSKKQTSAALSTAEAEYVATGQCCAQLLWMRQTLRDFGYNLSKVPLLCDNESAIRMTDNPVEHSRTKHIDIRHHFLRDHQQKGDIEVFYVSTENQLANIFTKPLDEKTFCKLRSEKNVLDSRNLD